MDKEMLKAFIGFGYSTHQEIVELLLLEEQEKEQAIKDSWKKYK